MCSTGARDWENGNMNITAIQGCSNKNGEMKVIVENNSIVSFRKDNLMPVIICKKEKHLVTLYLSCNIFKYDKYPVTLEL